MITLIVAMTIGKWLQKIIPPLKPFLNRFPELQQFIYTAIYYFTKNQNI